MTHHRDCLHCRASLPAPRSRALGKLTVVLAYATVLAFAVPLACMGPLGSMFLPLFVPGAIACITSAHAFASQDELCPACGKLVEHDAPVVASWHEDRPRVAGVAVGRLP